nr:MAG: hypothetical protein DIU55_14370 [Bacillota bacterium]
MVLIGLGAGAFWDGLYAPGQQMVAVLLAALLALAAPAVSLTRAEGAALLLLLAGAAGGLARPAAAGAAAHGPVLALGWALAFVAGRGYALRRPGEAEAALARFWAVIGALMAFGGLLLISFTPPHHSGRLASLLGYPIAVGMLGLLGLAGSLPDLAAGRRWASVLALGCALGLLLSGSRGVWAAALLLAGFLAWAAPDLLRAAGPAAGRAFAAALAAAAWAAPAVQAHDAARLWPVAAFALLTVALAEQFQHVRAVRAGFAGVLALALLTAPGWGWFWGRASTLPLTDSSSAERLAFLQDGLRLAAGLPWGAGYRAWTALHLQAASYGYYSAEVHSALLDLALAFGWAGAVGFALLAVRFLLGLRRARGWSGFRAAALGGLGALLLHALVDWELSYALFAFPLWFGFGLAGGEPEAAGSAGGQRIGPGSAGEGRRRPALRRQGIPWTRALTAAAAGLALAGAALLGAGDGLTELAARSLQRGEPQAALRHAGAALALTPWNDLAHGYRGAALAQLGRGEAALAAWRRARELGPYEPWYAQMAAAELGRQGRWLEAAAAWADYVRLWPWEVEAYAEAAAAHLRYLDAAEAAGDRAAAVRLAESGQRILAALERQKAREPSGAPRKGMDVDRPIFAEARERFAAVLGP